jgi:hypothetical protein
MAAKSEPRVPKPKTQGSSSSAHVQPVRTSKRPKMGGQPARTQTKNRSVHPSGQRGTNRGAH